MDPLQAFGMAVASMGDRLVVGAPGYDDARGVVYVFDSRGEQILTIPNPEADLASLFGSVITTLGDKIIVGVPDTLATPPFPSSMGVVYVFDGVTGTLENTLEQISFVPGRFGESLAAQGTDILIRAPGKHSTRLRERAWPTCSTASRASGARFRNPAPADPDDHELGPQDAFGTAVAIVGEFIVVGSPGNDDDVTDGGSLYVFKHQLAGAEQLSRYGISEGIGHVIAARFGLTDEETESYSIATSSTTRDSGVVYIVGEDGSLKHTLPNPARE